MKNPQIVPFLLTNFSNFLKWYHFQSPFYQFPRPNRGLILGGLRGLNEKFSNGTILLRNFGLFFKWYLLLAAKFSPLKPPGGYENMQKGVLIFRGFKGVAPPPWFHSKILKGDVSWTRKIKPPVCLFSYPPGGLRGLNFVASKRYHFKKGPKFLNKMVPFENFSFSPLKPPKVKPPFDIGN